MVLGARRPSSAAESASIAGPSGRLEALVDRPIEAPPRGVAVICHPHPLHQGTMHNKVVATLARSFSRCGFVTLRFNFRGVGASEGYYADGHGELDDTLAAIDWVRDRERRRLPLYLAGFSFGGAVATLAAARTGCRGLIAVAPAVARIPATSRLPSCRWLIVHGDADAIIASGDLRDWAARRAPQAKIAVLHGAGHFFHGRLNDLREHVGDFLQGAFARC